MKRPEKLDLFMSCIFALRSYSKTRAIFNFYMSEEEQGECLSYLGGVAGRPTMDPDEMFQISIANVGMLKLFLGKGVKQ